MLLSKYIFILFYFFFGLGCKTTYDLGALSLKSIIITTIINLFFLGTTLFKINSEAKLAKIKFIDYLEHNLMAKTEFIPFITKLQEHGANKSNNNLNFE